MTQQGNSRAKRVSVAHHEPLMGGDRYDYADAFEIRIPDADGRSAEQFARCALEEAPRLVRWTVRIAQRDVLRLRLGPDSSSGHLFGWKIRTSEADLIHLEARSPTLGRAVIVGRRTEPTRVVITTYVVYARPALARVVWMIVSPLHRWVARYLLERARAIGVGISAEAQAPQRQAKGAR